MINILNVINFRPFPEGSSQRTLKATLKDSTKKIFLSSSKIDKKVVYKDLSSEKILQNQGILVVPIMRRSNCITFQIEWIRNQKNSGKRYWKKVCSIDHFHAYDTNLKTIFVSLHAMIEEKEFIKIFRYCRNYEDYVDESYPDYDWSVQHEIKTWRIFIPFAFKYFSLPKHCSWTHSKIGALRNFSLNVFSRVRKTLLSP